MDVTFHKSMGRIIYDPKRPGMRNRVRASGANTNQWWCILAVDREITRYYRWWIERHLWGQTAVHPGWLCHPSWDGHISIVRGEVPKKDFRSLWKKYNGVEVEFEYAHYPYRTTIEDRRNRYAKDGDFWLVEVRCALIDLIREELGLRTHFRYHLTVGRTYDNRGV